MPTKSTAPVSGGDQEMSVDKSAAPAPTEAAQAASLEPPIGAAQQAALATVSSTIPGGAYIAADGLTWIDAEGRPLDAAKIAAAKAQAAERVQAGRVLQAIVAARAPSV